MIFEDLSYNINFHGKFDTYLIYKYGPGRGRPFWAERIGKKYQWIALYRLLGMVADNFKVKYRKKILHDLQARHLKDIDPTVLVRKIFIKNGVKVWWSPVEYDFKKYINISDSEWLDIFDFPNSEQMLLLENPKDGEEYYVLLAYPQWTSKKDPDDKHYKIIWMQIRSYLVPRKGYRKFWNWLKKQNFDGLPEGLKLFKDLIGEYPWALPYRAFFSTYVEWQNINSYLDQKFKILGVVTEWRDKGVKWGHQNKTPMEVKGGPNPINDEYFHNLRNPFGQGLTGRYRRGRPPESKGIRSPNDKNFARSSPGTPFVYVASLAS